MAPPAVMAWDEKLPARADADREAAHVERGVRLAHHRVVVHHRVLGDGNLGHRVAQVRGLPGARVALDHTDLAARPGHDQHPRLAEHRRRPARRREEEVYGVLDHHAAVHLDDRTVPEEGGVEGGERVPLEPREAPEVRRDGVEPPRLAGHRREAAHADPGRQARRVRQLRREAAVDEHQLRPAGPRQAQRVEGLAAGAVRRGRRLERRLDDGGDVREPPLLEPGGGEPEPVEAAERVVSQGPQRDQRPGPSPFRAANWAA